VAAALIALLAYRLLFPPPVPLTAEQMNDVVAQAMASATPPPAFSARVYQAIQPSLVLIQTDRPGEPGADEEHALGSGVVVNDNGDILTSLHVVKDASKIEVTFAHGTQSEAQVAVEVPENDIAVLSALTLPVQVFPAVPGNPYAMKTGDEAFAVGNPFGLYSSMSAGVISGFDRVYHPPDLPDAIRGLIQVDAAINPGNSGGPLLNSNGHVVGVVTGIINPTEDSFFIGIGFAVPINVAAGGGGGMPPY
jgi:S1-C subfamily serine protease